MGVVFGLFAQNRSVGGYDLDASECGEVGKAVAVPSGVDAATIDAVGVVWRRAGARIGGE
jgi:hypothetical protein